MKKAKTILKECFFGLIDCNEKAAIGAMKRYAEQFIDEAARIADEKFKRDDIECEILKLKDELKIEEKEKNNLDDLPF